MSKQLFKIWSGDRKVKKCCISEPILQNIIQKGILSSSSFKLFNKAKAIFEYILSFFKILANLFELHGSRLVLESDGTDIDDDETLVYFANEKLPFIILRDTEEWQELLKNNDIISSVQTINEEPSASVHQENIFDNSGM